jgi:membrane complex biogenesis BtpA family protein
LNLTPYTFLPIPKPIIGMIHLLPLPGTPGYNGSLDEIVDAALADARALDEGGIDAMMVENYGDVPFRKGDVEPHTIATMALIAAEIRRITSKPLGINVLRNDPLAALGIAAACGAVMIRVNVHTGAMLTDQGVIEGNANATLDYRTKLGAEVKILADVHVKHAAPLAPIPIETAAADAVERGLADALIVTGSRTGAGCDIEELIRVRAAVDAPVLAGSGVTDETIESILRECDGVIVGSWLKKDGDVRNAVDVDRVRRVMRFTIYD